jgi:hypothetical protein
MAYKADTIDSEAYANIEQFLTDKLSDEDLAEALRLAYLCLGGKMGTDEPPPFKGQPLTGGTKAQDAALRRRVSDAQANNYRKFQEHRDGLGLKPIRNLG